MTGPAVPAGPPPVARWRELPGLAMLQACAYGSGPVVGRRPLRLLSAATRLVLFLAMPQLLGRLRTVRTPNGRAVLWTEPLTVGRALTEALVPVAVVIAGPVLGAVVAGWGLVAAGVAVPVWALLIAGLTLAVTAFAVLTVDHVLGPAETPREPGEYPGLRALPQRVAPRLRRETGRPVVVVAGLAAWPRGSGAGRALLDASTGHLDATGTWAVTVARSAALSTVYTQRYGFRPDSTHPGVLVRPPQNLAEGR